MNAKGMLTWVCVCLLAGAASAATTDDFDGASSPATPTQSGSAPGPAVTPAGPTGQFLRLINDGVNNQRNHSSYDLTDAGAFATITADFDFSGYSADQPADGFSFSLIPTGTYGNSGMGPNLSESANAAGTFGLGFRTHPGGTNNLVLHWNNAALRTAGVPIGSVSFRDGSWNDAHVELQQVGPGSNVLVQLTGTSTNTPIHQYVFGLIPYENRVQFSGRTGGANMHADFDNINVQYSNPYAAPPTVSPATLLQDFDSLGTTPFVTTQAGSIPGPLVQSGGPTGNYLRLINDGAGSQNNALGFNRASDGGVSNTLKMEFDFRGNDNNPADGFSMMLLPTASHGDSGASPFPSPTEKPNLANVFGVGFDFYPNPGTNDVSVHWNGAQIQNVTVGGLDLNNGQFHRAEIIARHVAGGSNVTVNIIPDVLGTPGTPVNVVTDLFVPGMVPYDYRVGFAGRTGGANMNVDLDNITSSKAPLPQAGTDTVQDFEGGGSAYQVNSYGSAPFPAIRNDAGPEGNYLRLVNPAGGQDNVIALDRTAEGKYGRITASFDMRITSGADGAAFALMNTGDYGVTGAGPASGPFPGGDGWEEANLLNSFAVGFDIYNNIRQVSLHWAEAVRANVDSTFDYRSATDFNTVDIALDFGYGGAYVDLSIAGNPVYTNQWIAGITPYEARAALGGRTGGVTCTLDVDDFNVRYFRDTVTWINPGTGNYPDGPNWDSGHSPSHADHAMIPLGQADSTNLEINGPGSVTVSGTGILNNTGNLQVGTMAGETGVLNVDGGAVNTSGWLRLAPQAGTDATVNQTSGTVTVAGRFEMTDNSSAQSAYHLSGDGVLTVNGDYFIVGRQGIGTFTQSDTSVVNVNVSQRMLMGDVGGSDNSSYTMTGGELNVNNGRQLVVGKSGSAAFYQTGGTVNASGRLNIAGEVGGTSGRWEISGDAVLNVGGDYFLVGQAGEGTFVQSGSSTVNANLGTQFIVGDWGGAVGDYELSGGTLNVGNGRTIYVGKNGDGHFLQTGGTVNASGRLHVGGGTTSDSDYRLEDGTVNVGTHLVVGDSGRGTFTQTGGTVNVLTGGHGLYVGDQSTSTGTYEISGGVLDVNAIRRGGHAGNTSTFHIFGGAATISTVNEYTLNDANCTLIADIGNSGISTVSVGSTASVGGDLDVDIWGGVALTTGQSFDVLRTATAGNVSGTLNVIDPEPIWAVTQDGTVVRATITGPGQGSVTANYDTPANVQVNGGAGSNVDHLTINGLQTTCDLWVLLDVEGAADLDDLADYIATSGQEVHTSHPMLDMFAEFDLLLRYDPQAATSYFSWDLSDYDPGVLVTQIGVGGVPEPITMLSLLVGTAALGGYIRRRRTKRS